MLKITKLSHRIETLISKIKCPLDSLNKRLKMTEERTRNLKIVSYKLDNLRYYMLAVKTPSLHKGTDSLKVKRWEKAIKYKVDHRKPK